MALPSPYLAAENSAAERRSRALHRFIVASPVLLLISVGLVGHLRHRPYASLAGSSEYDRRALAYRERVIAASALPEGDDPPLKPLSQEAARWDAGFESGSLGNLPPASYEDHFQNDVRGEVFRTGIALASNLSLAAEGRLASGHPAEAAPAALLAARLANGLRGFELVACFQALIAQRRALEVLARSWPSLSAPERLALRPAILCLRVDPKEIDGFLDVEEAQLQDYCRRQRISPEEFRRSSPRLGAQAIVAIRRSLRLGNGQVDALLKPVTTEERS